jgi:4-amino-4-deoxy-L-arabinose transferase-like glycosyltransferase
LSVKPCAEFGRELVPLFSSADRDVPSARTRSAWGLIILILLLGLVLRVAVLNDATINHDELYQYERDLRHSSLWQIPLSLLRIGDHAPAMLMAKASSSLLGDSLFSLRWPVACMSLLSVVLIFKVAGRLFGDKASLTSAFLLSVSPYAVSFAYDFRGYTGLVFYPLLACYFSMRAIETARWWRWLGIAALWAAATYNHVCGVLAWPGITLVVLTWAATRRSPTHTTRTTAGLVLSSLTGILAGIIIPTGPAIVRFALAAISGMPHDTTAIYISQNPDLPATLWSTLLAFSGVYLDRIRVDSPAPYLLIALIGLSALLSLRRRRLSLVLCLMVWWLLPFAVIAIGQLLIPSLAVRDRYLIFALPAFLMVVALAPAQLDQALQRWLPHSRTACRISAIPIVTIVAVLWVVSFARFYEVETNGSWTAVMSYLAPRLDARDLMLCEPYNRDTVSADQLSTKVCQRNITYWSRAKGVGLLYPVLPLEQAGDYQAIASNLQAASRLGRVWLVVFDVPPDVAVRLQGAGGVREWERIGTTLLLPPPEDVTLVQAMMVHLEHLSRLPHTPKTLLDYHLQMAQLAAVQGMADRAQQEWQAAEQIYPDVPDSANAMEITRRNVAQPPLLQAPRTPMKIHLGETIRFDGFTLSAGEAVSPRDTLRVTLFWSAIAGPPDDYTVFLHLRDNKGNVVLQDDFMPSPNTRGWWPGDLVWQGRDIPVPADVGAGEYLLCTGMYLASTMQRLPVSPAQPSNDDSVCLTSLRVTR